MHQSQPMVCQTHPNQSKAHLPTLAMRLNQATSHHLDQVTVQLDQATVQLDQVTVQLDQAAVQLDQLISLCFDQVLRFKGKGRTGKAIPDVAH